MFGSLGWGVFGRLGGCECVGWERVNFTKEIPLNSHGVGAHGFSTERARLAGGTSRLLNMGILNKKKGLLNMGILNKKRPAEYGDFEPKFPKSQT